MMKKRFVSLLAAVGMLCTMMLTSCSAAGTPTADNTGGPSGVALAAASGFPDVPANAWYAEAVAYCQQNGIMSGTSDAAFSPEETMTRAMLAAVLYRMNGSPAAGTPGFTDTAAGLWYSDAVAWAAENDVISGYADGSFGVDTPATREQAAAILWRYAGSPQETAETGLSDDTSVSEWAKPAVRWAVASGIADGMTDGNRFDPQANIKRGEIASMLFHYLDKYLKKSPAQQPETTSGGKTLIAYFSATGTTRPIAEYAAEILSADLYEIVPEEPYTEADLAYYTNGRADREQSDAAARPAISGSVPNMAEYTTVFLGYPIWHGQAPKIIYTFLESYDFTGKTIVPFCTSHSSGIGSSDTNLRSLASGADWLPGRRFASGTDRNTVKSWINGLELPQAAAPVSGQTDHPGGFNFETGTVLLNSGYEMPINGLGTYSLTGDTCVRSVTEALNRGVRLIDTAYMYSNEESVGKAIRESGIPREEIFVITKLYPNQFANAEAAIEQALQKLDIGYIDMMLLHHPGTRDVEAYKAMERAVEAGKIRSIGLSNWYVKELQSFLPQISITPALVQNEIHPYYQENDVIPYIQSLGITVQGWYPLGGRGHTAELLGDPVISEIAAAHGKSSAQVILRWNLQKGVVVIPGSSNPEHIQENTELYDFSLTDEEMQRINALDRNEKHDWY